MTTNESVIYTNENDCRDCYKCIRNCPVEAISMIDNHAHIDKDRCIACGICIDVCPVGAQNYRKDYKKVPDLLSSGKKVILSLAPSFAGEFDMEVSELISRILQLGFFGVSETALGAQIVTYHQRKILQESDQTWFSSACPTFVHYIVKYKPELKKYLSPLMSPLLNHCAMLKNYYGQDTAIVFAGPCIAKKLEADQYPELLDLALTFEELKELLKQTTKENKENAQFIPCQSNSGAIYPIDGGMIETINKMSPNSVTNSSFYNISGMKNITDLIKKEEASFEKGNLFCEFLACDGGCINGSGLKDKGLSITKKERVINYYKTLPLYSEDEFIKKYDFPVKKANYDFCQPIRHKDYSITEKEKIWRKLGKFKPEDFLDCGGCGYDTCEKFAIACIEKRAQINMCVSSMRNQAITKVQSFMKATPMGMCVIDSDLKIVECNYKFIELSVDVDIEITDELVKRVQGTPVNKFFKIDDIVRRVLLTHETENKIINQDNRIFSLTLFSFDGNTLAGLLVNDITEPSMKKDIITQKAKEVIKNNLLTIQKIAHLLGETAAETEITLNEIIKAYKSDNPM